MLQQQARLSSILFRYFDNTLQSHNMLLLQGCSPQDYLYLPILSQYPEPGVAQVPFNSVNVFQWR
jgi:hypothetical protein